MGGFFSALGKSLAERWLSLLALPGALFCAVALAAHTTGQRHPFQVGGLADHFAHWSQSAALRHVSGQVLLLIALLVGAAGTGAAAQALGSLVEQLALADDWRQWPNPLRDLVKQLVASRRTRWDKASAHWQRAETELRLARENGEPPSYDTRDEAYWAMARISVERPDRPTWSGDRLNAVGVRLNRDLHLDLAVVWPYLWLRMPHDVREEMSAARAALSRAATLLAWSLLYLLLAGWWWPATLVAAGAALAGRSRLRSATHEYAELLEAVTRSRVGELADGNSLTPEQGEQLTHALQRSKPYVPTQRR